MHTTHVFVDGSCIRRKFMAIAFFNATTSEVQAKALEKYGNHHRAELEAIRFVLEHYQGNGVRILAIYSDSRLAVNVINRKWHPPRYLKKLCKRIRALQHRYDKVVVAKIPREQNFEANRYAQMANGIPEWAVH